LTISRREFSGVPTGHFENSPAFQCRVKCSETQVPQGRLNFKTQFTGILTRGHFPFRSIVPSGLNLFLICIPAINGRAIIGNPVGIL
jgi:hypothetical protein